MDGIKCCQTNIYKENRTFLRDSYTDTDTHSHYYTVFTIVRHRQTALMLIPESLFQVSWPTILPTNHRLLHRLLPGTSLSWAQDLLNSRFFIVISIMVICSLLFRMLMTMYHWSQQTLFIHYIQTISDGFYLKHLYFYSKQSYRIVAGYSVLQSFIKVSIIILISEQMSSFLSASIINADVSLPQIVYCTVASHTSFVIQNLTLTLTSK